MKRTRTLLRWMWRSFTKTVDCALFVFFLWLFMGRGALLDTTWILLDVAAIEFALCAVLFLVVEVVDHHRGTRKR